MIGQFKLCVPRISNPLKDRTVTYHRNGKRWVVDHNQLKECLSDVELYLDVRSESNFSAGHVTNMFEFNKRNSNGVLLTHVRPDILDNFCCLAEVNAESEFWFVVDRSASMTGCSMRHAKHCLKCLTHQLPPKCHFNLVSFGSHFSFLWDQPIKYDLDNLERAKKYISAMEADFGGTELVELFKGIPQKLLQIYEYYMNTI